MNIELICLSLLEYNKILIDYILTPECNCHVILGGYADRAPQVKRSADVATSFAAGAHPFILICFAILISLKNCINMLI